MKRESVNNLNPNSSDSIRLSIKHRLIILFSLIACLAVLASGLGTYFKTKKVMIESEHEKIETLCRTMSLLINTDIHNAIAKKLDTDDISYLEYRTKLESIKSIYPEISTLFTIAPKEDNPEQWIYVISVARSINEEFRPGELYKNPIDISKQDNNYIDQLLIDGKIKLSPIFNSQGKISAMFGFALDPDYLAIREKNLRLTVYLAAFISIVIALLFNYFLWLEICAPINKFIEHIAQMINGNYSSGISTFTNDEFGKLDNGLNILAETLKKRENMAADFEKIVNIDKAKFKSIIDSMSDGVFTVDKNMKITEFNTGAEKITGFTREQAIGEFCKNIFHRDFCEGNCSLLNVAKTGEAVTNVESNIISRDNRIIPILSSYSPLKDEKGNIIGSVENFRDITEFKKMHENMEIAKNQAIAYSNILQEQNKELLETYTRLEVTQRKTEEYLRKLESTNYFLDKKIIELSKLNEFSIALSSILDVDELLHIVIRSFIEQMNADSGSLMLLDESKKELVVKVAYGNYTYDIFNAKVKVGEGISGWVAAHGESLLVTNIEKDPRFKNMSKERYESKSLISVPLKVKDRAIGVLNINHKKTKESFNKADLDLLLTIINQASIAIENANLYEKLQQSYFETVLALTMAVEAKDSWTRGHSDRVIKYALDIGKSMGLSERQLEKIRYAGALHDIGKIGISELIINKERYLTKEEYAIIQKHPVIGASIIEPIEFLHPIQPIIRHHHEHFDGNGYPDGLAGDNILYEARILAVADAYDAMTSDRPYRQALSVTDALFELKKHAGTQFDPKIVGIFEDVLLRRKNEKNISN
ncbi:GAF domain-containing protein [Candidatus Poribacteria bacterium]|nr:GAF domain-containing protein [Candidatus Poribacteria bacterium]